MLVLLESLLMVLLLTLLAFRSKVWLIDSRPFSYEDNHKERIFVFTIHLFAILDGAFECFQDELQVIEMCCILYMMSADI